MDLMASELDPKTTLVRAADPSSRSGRRTSTSALPPDLLGRQPDACGSRP